MTNVNGILEVILKSISVHNQGASLCQTSIMWSLNDPEKQAELTEAFWIRQKGNCCDTDEYCG